MTHIEITPEMTQALATEWAATDVPTEGPDRHSRAMLTAALAVIQRTHHVIPREPRLEGMELALDPILERYPDDPEVATLVASVAKFRRMVLQPRTMDPLEQRGEGGWIQLVAWLMDQLGQRQVTVPTVAFEEDQRQLNFWRDFNMDAWVLEVSTAVDHIPPTTEDPA